NGESGWKYLLSHRVQQKRRLPVLAAAADRGREVAHESARTLRKEPHPRPARAQLARIEPRDGAARALASNCLGVLQFAPIPGTAVPVVTLHVLAGAGEHHAAHAVSGGGLAAHE